MARLRVGEKARVGGQAALLHGAIDIEQGLADVVHLPQVGQVRRMAKAGQLIEQGIQGPPLARLLLPARQQRLGVEQNVHGLGQEAGGLLRVALAASRMLGIFMQAGQAHIHRLADLLDQIASAGDGRQRRAVQLCQPQVEQ
ncbi:hypothetical protein D3C80_1614950 [compost metagenome]